MVWFTDEAIAAWAAEPRTTRGGQAWYSPLAILTALTLRAVFRLAYRHAEGLIGSVISLLGLTLRVPDHTTLSRRSATLAVPRPQLVAADGDVPPVHLLVDSTGLKLCGAGEWLVEKHGTKRRRAWRKLHLGVDADIAARHPDAVVIVPPRSTAVPSGTAATKPTQRDRHLQCIAESRRLAWQRASGYNRRAKIEAAIGRWKQ
jgi:hypothetical protein